MAALESAAPPRTVSGYRKRPRGTWPRAGPGKPATGFSLPAKPREVGHSGFFARVFL